MCILFETDNKNIIVTKGTNHIDVKTGVIFITRINQELQEKDSGKNCKKTRVRQEVKEKKESVKNTRTQESCQKIKISFYRQESCIEGIAKESCLIIKKNKNLERMMARTSTSENSTLSLH